MQPAAPAEDESEVSQNLGVHPSPHPSPPGEREMLCACGATFTLRW
jgi:hypothetical protein